MSFRKLGPLRTSTRFGRLRRTLFGPNSRERFHSEVLSAFDFMFKEHGAQIVSWGEGRWNGVDSAVVETVADRMRISFERDRGEYMIRIGPESGTASDRQDLGAIVRSLDPQLRWDAWSKGSFAILATFLQTRWPDVEAVVLEDQAPKARHIKA